MQLIIKYCTEELKMSQSTACMLIKQFQNHPDILIEFEKWISERTFDVQNPVVAEGYTAKKISEIAPFLDGVGVYKFLITLREKPEVAKKYIEQGFPKK